MRIKLKYNLLFVFTLLIASFFVVACSSSTHTTVQKSGYSQQEIDQSFKRAEDLFDEDKSNEAYNIFKKLADQGDAKSQNALGNGYEYGFWGEIDLKQAKYWYQKAADQNYAGGIHNLGMLEFLQGNYKQALPYFEKGAALKSSESMTLLGAYYSEGILSKQNYKKALQYFSQAISIDPENASALFNIGQAYYYGHGVEKNYNKAFAWYTKSANQDYSLAQIQLAEMYFSGKAVPKNVTKAIEIITPLAESGDPKAQENLRWYLDHQH